MSSSPFLFKVDTTTYGVRQRVGGGWVIGQDKALSSFLGCSEDACVLRANLHHAQGMGAGVKKQESQRPSHPPGHGDARVQTRGQV